MAPDRHPHLFSRPADPAESSTLPCVGAGSAEAGATAPGDTTAPPNTSPPPALGSDCWILSGPTAAGKTALALTLAERLDAEIVSVDSMAVYRGLDIGTAKPTAAERAAVPHHGLDLVAPTAAFSVAQWLAATHEAVADIRSRGKRVLFVGGTPLYLRSLRDGLAPVPAEDPQVRRRLANEAAALGLPALHARLEAIDPAAASRIHPNDAKRLLRALEVAEIAGRPLSDVWARSQAGTNAASPTFTTQMLVVDLPRRILYDRIERRVEAMFSAGLIEETRAALAAGGIGPTARQAAGYTEAIDLIEGRLSLAAAIERTKTRTRQLAKRQLTWLRSFHDAIWIPA
jgi:tRNA dimethylallyltransferase